jgi:hypothetical protein
MNRMARNTLLGCPLVLVFAVSGFAQSPTPAEQQRDRLIQRYDNCVLTVSLGLGGPKQLVAEQSFFACQTEEQALRSLFSIVGLDQPFIQSIIVKRKLRLKTIILADPR